MKPTIGRIVIYNTTESQQRLMELTPLSNTQKQLPAMVVAVWSDDCVNLKVITDGHTDPLWITSANKGDESGQWNWPKIEK